MNSVTVIFDEDLTLREFKRIYALKKSNVFVAPLPVREIIESHGAQWVSLEKLVRPGNIYEAAELVREFSYIAFPDGTRVATSFHYKGFELWWARYNGIYLYFCVPYTQFKDLLEYIVQFESIHLYKPKYISLFICYARAHNRTVRTIKQFGTQILPVPPFGILLQIILTIINIPFLVMRRHAVSVFTGDKFDTNRDYDFRMKYIYEELRKRQFSFMEFVRSLESWKTVLQHALVRRRPVLYYEALSHIGKFLSHITCGRYVARQKFGPHRYVSVTDPLERFKLIAATHHMLTIYDDIWAVRITRILLRIMGIRTAIFTAAVERNWHTVLGCKLNNIPTIGIMHGMHPRHYVLFDFLPGFDGKKPLSVDKYGVWSAWWRDYYLQYSDAYRPSQLFVSGPMRPIEKKKHNRRHVSTSTTTRVLLISEQLAAPHEVMPYIEALLEQSTMKVTFQFRPFRDGFQEWLSSCRPDLLENGRIATSDVSLQDAIASSDVIVGSHSTAVLEALLQSRVPILFQTQKWGDYFELQNHPHGDSFFATSPHELVQRVREAQFVPESLLQELRNQFFGDGTKNGSKWVVDQVEVSLKGRN